MADLNPVGVFPWSFISHILGSDATYVRSWFNFWMLPAVSVVSFSAGESKAELDNAMKRVEKSIQELMDEGVPSQNIVVVGFSQGGALALYTSIHTKYKLGGFIPMATWLPLVKAEPIKTLPNPVNVDTPIFQVNGIADLVVPLYPAGEKTRKEMKKVFSKYTYKAFVGTHLTIGRYKLTIRSIKKWMKKNTNLKFR